MYVILVLNFPAFTVLESAASKSMGLLEGVAEEVKGKGTLAFVDCR